MASTLEEILTEVKSLSVEDRRRLVALLEAQMRAEEGHKSLEQLLTEQGTRPLTFQELLGEPSVGQDDGIDEFLAQLGKWRSEHSSRAVD